MELEKVYAMAFSQSDRRLSGSSVKEMIQSRYQVKLEPGKTSTT
jgi:hypothetical protein